MSVTTLLERKKALRQLMPMTFFSKSLQLNRQSTEHISQLRAEKRIFRTSKNTIRSAAICKIVSSVFSA